MQRRDFVKAASFAILAGGARSVSADGPNADVFSSSLIAAPDDPSRWPAFREDLAKWRGETRKQLNYDDTLYRRKDFAWVPSSFACCFLMLCDQAFYSRDQNRCLADSWLDAGTAEFGGYDSIVLWHAYPRIGLDQRNQFDFYRDMPGGLDGLHKLTRAFQARGVKVYVDYNPWDTGTRREGVSDIDALVLLVKTLDADGIFLDTLNKGSAQFRARLDDARPGIVLESEGALPLESIHDHHMSWAQGFRDSAAPGVLRNKWFERRHMQHQIHRWNHDHTSELHTAWMNGSGMMVWENVFGSWVGWSKRDRSILRSMLPIQRRYSALFAGEGWSPLVSTEMPGVYASLWEAGGLRLWTLVNRAEEEREGILLNVQDQPGARYFDLIRGREIQVSGVGDVVSIPGAIRPRGIACVLSASGAALGSSATNWARRST